MATFASLVRSLDAGLKSLDVSISSQCAAAVDNLAGFYFKGCAEEAPSPAAQAIPHRCIPASASPTCSDPEQVLHTTAGAVFWDSDCFRLEALSFCLLCSLQLTLSVMLRGKHKLLVA